VIPCDSLFKGRKEFKLDIIGQSQPVKKIKECVDFDGETVNLKPDSRFFV
jgi:hypothetical protein